jgi:hypothetical protein
VPPQTDETTRAKQLPGPITPPRCLASSSCLLVLLPQTPARPPRSSVAPSSSPAARPHGPRAPPTSRDCCRQSSSPFERGEFAF